MSGIFANAQSARWSAPLEANVDQPFAVSLVFEDCQPNGNIILPAVDGITFTSTGQSRQINMVQGRVSSVNTFTYTARASRADRFVLPSFSVETTAGRLTIGELVLSVKPARAGAASSLDEVLSGTAIAQLNTNVTEAWVGQVIPLEYRLLVNPRSRTQLGGAMVWPGTGWLAESWGEPERGETFHEGSYWISLSQKTNVMTDVPGERVLEAATQRLIITTGQRNTWPFPQAITEEATVKSTDRIITVRPLPAAPDDTFTGAVGNFDILSSVTPQVVTAGEPLTWTLIISGTGNWPSNFRTPEREIPEGWRVIGPEIIRENPPGKIFQASIKEEAVLIPDLPGTYTLPGVVFTYFDPQRGRYVSATTEEITVTVQPSASQIRQAQQPQNLSGLTGTNASELPSMATAPVIPVEKIEPSVPREPLAGAARAVAPLGKNTWLGLLAMPWILAPIGLVFLGIAHAKANDPARRRLVARQDMLLAIAKAQMCEGRADRVACVQRWRKAAATYWGVTQAVPTPADFERSTLLAAEVPDVCKKWMELFSDADHFLYGASPSLPRLWLVHAEEATKNLRPKLVSVWNGFRIEHLFPKRAVVAASLVASLFFAAGSLVFTASGDEASEGESESAAVSATGTDSDALAAYSRGEWQVAEKIWRAKTEADPRDWHAHNNLALALMQQSFWQEASAHLLAARLLAPGSEDVIWNGDLAARQLTTLTPELSNWLRMGMTPFPAGLGNAALWQWLFLVASWLAAAAIFLLLCVRHFPNYGKRFFITALVLAFVSLPQAGLAFFATSQWGHLMEGSLFILRQDVRLRSLPTEADKQISRAARPGETAVAVGHFLRWTKLKFPSGEAAWAPSASVIPVYHAVKDK